MTQSGRFGQTMAIGIAPAAELRNNSEGVFDLGPTVSFKVRLELVHKNIRLYF